MVILASDTLILRTEKVGQIDKHVEVNLDAVPPHYGDYYKVKHIIPHISIAFDGNVHTAYLMVEEFRRVARQNSLVSFNELITTARDTTSI